MSACWGFLSLSLLRASLGFFLVGFWVDYCLFLYALSPSACGLRGFYLIGSIAFFSLPLSFMGSWCSYIPWYPLFWSLDSSPGFSLATGFSRFLGCLSFRSCHLLAFLLSALSLRFLSFSSASTLSGFSSALLLFSNVGSAPWVLHCPWFSVWLRWSAIVVGYIFLFSRLLSSSFLGLAVSSSFSLRYHSGVRFRFSFFVGIPPSKGFLRLSSVSLWAPPFPCAALCSSLSFVVVVSASLFPFLSFVPVVHLPLLVGWLISFSGFLPLRVLLGFLVIVLLWGFLPLLHCLSCSLVSFDLWALFCLGRISGSLRDGVLPLGRVSCLLGFLHSLSFPCPVRVFGLSALVDFGFSFSPSPVLVLSPSGSFFFGVRATPLPWVSRLGFGLSALLVLLWFSLAVFRTGPFSALFSTSASFRSFLTDVVLLWGPLPSFLYAPVLPALAGRYFSSVCSLSHGLLRCCFAPALVFLSPSLFSILACVLPVAVSCSSSASALCLFFCPSFVTRSNLSSFTTRSSLWAESALSAVAFMSVLPRVAESES